MINYIANEKVVIIHPALNNPKTIFAADGIDGCHITTGMTSQSRLYHTPYTLGSGSPTQWIEVSDDVKGFNMVTATKCFNTSNIPCQVYNYGTTSSTPPLSAIKYSGFYALVTTNCPIDDYVPVFFIFTAGIACISINKRYKNINEGISDNRSV